MDQKEHNSKITILLAEDEAAVRNMLRRALEVNGSKLLIAEDGQEALRIASEHSDDIDLLISNVQMPGMTGPDLAREMRRTRPNVRIMMVSAYPQGMLVLDHGWQYLQKPFLPKAIIKKIEEVMAQFPATDTHGGEPQLGQIE